MVEETGGSRSVQAEREQPQVIEEGVSLQILLRDDHFLQELERSIANYKKFVTLCYRMTREKHWCDHGKPGDPKYTLQGPGAEAMMTPLNISFDRPEFTRVDLGEGHYAYWVQGYMESGTLRRRGFYLGYCDSLDRFFNARPGWSPKTGEGDVKKSAYTNWEVNAVSRLAGIRDPDPDLLKAAGLRAELIPRIDYQGGKTPEESAGIISEPQQKRLWAIAKSKGVSADVIKVHLGAHYQLPSIKVIPRKHYDTIVKWVEQGGKVSSEEEAKYEAWAKSLQGGGGNGGNDGEKKAPATPEEPQA